MSKLYPKQEFPVLETYIRIQIGYNLKITCVCTASPFLFADTRARDEREIGRKAIHIGGLMLLFSVKPSCIHFSNSFDGGFST